VLLILVGHRLRASSLIVGAFVTTVGKLNAKVIFKRFQFTFLKTDNIGIVGNDLLQDLFFPVFPR
jgi:hypothetical protein